MKIPRPHRPSARSFGFTMVEMLTVVGIIALLVALVTPALVDVIRSTRLSSAGDSLVNRISLAQQSSVSTSSEVEVRFYKYTDPDSDTPGTSQFYAYQVVQTPSGGTPRALSEVYYIESGVILSSQIELSPLLQSTVAQTEVSPGVYLFRPAVSGLDPADVSYAAIRFYADGGCRLLTADAPGVTAAQSATAYTIPPLNESFFTVVESRQAESTLAPNNFFCVQIDSYTGKTRVYRP